jgi:DNA invertase Pin-like site-specific DNA recombinase
VCSGSSGDVVLRAPARDLPAMSADDELTPRPVHGPRLIPDGVRLSIGGTVYDPTDPMGKRFFNILATFAEFEVDLVRMRTREGMAIARANGRLKGKAPKLSARQRVHVLGLAQGGEHTIAELAELFSVSRATI